MEFTLELKNVAQKSNPATAKKVQVALRGVLAVRAIANEASNCE